MAALDPAVTRLALSLGLLIGAFAVLAPGVTLPVIELTGTVERARIAQLGIDTIAADRDINRFFRSIALGVIDELDVQGHVTVYEQRRSILGTVRELWDSGNRLVGFLVLLFSVIIPVCKGLLIVAASLGRTLRWRGHAMATANAISKWSMADVFVVASIVALLAANASGDTNDMLTFDARFGSGFYYFVAYCLLSVASAQLMPRGLTREPPL